MEFNKQDAIQVENLIKAYKKGTFNLDGMEVMAMSDCMRWLGGLHKIINDQVAAQEEKAAKKAADAAAKESEKKSELKQKK